MTFFACNSEKGGGSTTSTTTVVKEVPVESTPKPIEPETVEMVSNLNMSMAPIVESYHRLEFVEGFTFSAIGDSYANGSWYHEENEVIGTKHLSDFKQGQILYFVEQSVEGEKVSENYFIFPGLSDLTVESVRVEEDDIVVVVKNIGGSEFNYDSLIDTFKVKTFVDFSKRQSYRNVDYSPEEYFSETSNIAIPKVGESVEVRISKMPYIAFMNYFGTSDSEFFEIPLYINIDPEGVIREYNRFNNKNIFPLRFFNGQERADVAIESVELMGSEIKLKMKNDGFRSVSIEKMIVYPKYNRDLNIELKSYPYIQMNQFSELIFRADLFPLSEGEDQSWVFEAIISGDEDLDLSNNSMELNFNANQVEAFEDDVSVSNFHYDSSSSELKFTLENKGVNDLDRVRFDIADEEPELDRDRFYEQTNLVAGEQREVSISFDEIFFSGTIGEKVYSVVLDKNDSLWESNEVNNVATTTFTLDPFDVEVVSSLEEEGFFNIAYKLGGSFKYSQVDYTTFRILSRVQGNGSFRNQIDLTPDSWELGVEYTSSVSISEIMEKVMDYYDGQTVDVFAEFITNLNEVNTENNKVKLIDTIVVPRKLPNLTISEINTSTEGLSWKVVNIGDKDFYEYRNYLRIKITINGVTKTERFSYYLDVGEDEAEVGYFDFNQFGLELGQRYDIVAELVLDSPIEEKSLDDNRLETFVQMPEPPKPNFAVESIIRNETRIIVYIENTETTICPGCTEYPVKILNEAGDLVAEKTIDLSMQNKNMTRKSVTFNYADIDLAIKTPSTLTAVLNSGNIISEVSYDDNSGEFPFTKLGYYDLKVESISKTLNGYNVLIKNIGISTTSNYDVVLEYNGETIRPDFSPSNKTVYTGSMKTFSFSSVDIRESWIPILGEKISAIVNFISDDDNSDNKLVSEFEIPYFDLEVTEINSIEGGISVSVKNHGPTLSSYHSGKLKVQFNDNEDFDTGVRQSREINVGDIAQGETKQYQITGYQYNSLMGNALQTWDASGHLHAKVDFENDLNEVNENNNYLHTNYSLPSPKIDIEVTRMYWLSSSQLTVVGKNNGDACTINCPKVKGKFYAVDEDGNANNPVEVEFAIPSSTDKSMVSLGASQLGLEMRKEYQIFFEADHNEIFPEENEEDNIGSVTYTHRWVYDLEVTDFSYDSETKRWTVNVLNQGKDSVKFRNVTVRGAGIGSNDIFFKDLNYTNSIYSGQKSSFTIDNRDLKFHPGEAPNEISVVVRADYDNDLVNNTLVKTIDAPFIDFELGEVTIDSVNQKIDIQYFSKGAGLANAATATGKVFFLESNPIVVNLDLEEGEHHLILEDYSWIRLTPFLTDNANQSTATLTVLLDDRDYNFESNEENNSIEKSHLFSAAKADLTISSFSLDYDRIVINVKNDGPARVAHGSNFTINLRAGEIEKNLLEWTTFYRNEEKEYIIPLSEFPLQDGAEYTITVTVDHSQVVDERNEDNNAYSTTLVMSDLPESDLSIKSVAVNDFYLDIEVQNLGEKTNRDLNDFNISVQSGDDFSKIFRLVKVPAALGTELISIPLSELEPLRGQMASFNVALDIENTIVEVDEENNSGNFDIFIPERGSPDFRVVDIYKTHSNIDGHRSGEMFVVLIENMGTEYASPSSVSNLSIGELTLSRNTNSWQEIKRGRRYISRIPLETMGVYDALSVQFPNEENPNLIVSFDFDVEQNITEFDEENNSFEIELPFYQDSVEINFIDDSANFEMVSIVQHEDLETYKFSFKYTGDLPSRALSPQLYIKVFFTMPSGEVISGSYNFFPSLTFHPGVTYDSFLRFDHVNHEIPEGFQSFKVVIDHDGLIDETNEIDNEMNYTVE
jgi:hypothetical protein